MSVVGIITLGIAPVSIYIFSPNTSFALFTIGFLSIVFAEFKEPIQLLYILGSSAYPISIILFVFGVARQIRGYRSRLLYALTLGFLMGASAFILFIDDSLDGHTIAILVIAAFSYFPALVILTAQGANKSGEGTAGSRAE